ncbi:MAG: tetratricopeptide repeat protein [Alphaproteobacteria bacterium]|nr:tetratricopeptide repeat protein [Alphaproteobacteria bacterium]
MREQTHFVFNSTLPLWIEIKVLLNTWGQYLPVPESLYRAQMLRYCLALVALLFLIHPAYAGGMADADAGSTKLSAGDARGAIILFTRALQDKDLTAEARALTYHHRGVAFHQNGQPGRAILDYTQALWKNGLPRDVRPRTLNNRGLAYEALGDDDSALRDYNLALKLNPAYAEAYANRGNLNRKFNRHDLAIADYEMAIRNAHPRPKYVYVSMGLSLEALGKRTEAIDAYRHALAIDPRYQQAKDRLNDLEERAARQKVMAAHGGRQSMVASRTPTAPVVIAALPGNQITSVRADAEPTAAWPLASAAVASDAIPAPMPASVALRPSLRDQDGVARAPAAAPPVAPAEPTPAVERMVVPVQPTKTTSRRTPGFEIISVAEASTPEPAAPPPVPTAPAVTGQGFGVQVGSFKSEALALRGWKTVLNRSGNLLDNLKPAVEAVPVPGKGTMYRLFADSFPERSGAATLCQALKAKGASCLVVER